jgi:hemerythrin-like domain-containing protein
MRRDPFEMLERCHRRLEEELQAVVMEPARDVAERVLEFLDRTIKRHELDEEESLFPRLPASLAPLLADLTAAHRHHDELIQHLREARDEKATQITALALQAAYARHISLEERSLFPAAKAALDAPTLATIATEMQHRRGH